MALKKVGNIYGTGGLKKVGNINDQNFNQPQQAPKSKLGSAWNWTTNQLIKPVASASNLLEDTGKTLAFPIAKMAGYKGSWQDAKKSQGIDFLGHQKDVLGGANKRTYSDITRDAFKDGSKAQQRAGQIVGYGGDFLLDPLNKLKIAALTAKGKNAEKVGQVALSMADQAEQGQRALLQIGKWNVLPSVGNRVLAGSTKLNDVIRGTETGKKLMTIGSKVSGKIRPGGVSRDEFKILTDAKTAARDTVGYTTGKAIEFAKGLAKELKKRKATDFDGSQLLHAIEKGREDLAPEKLKDLWKVGTDFKVQNEEAWKKLGGSVLDNYGMAHVATKEVSEAARKKALQGGKLFSTQTPQDIHREWMKVDGKITNIKDAGIKYDIPTSQPIQKTANPLIQEARKYKGIEMDYVRNTEKSPKRTDFAQHIEPAGKYMNLGDPKYAQGMPNMETGKIKFDNPLVVEWKTSREGGWKTDLSNKYGGKKGKALSEAIRKDGYDGIITVDNGNTAEVVSLKDFQSQPLQEVNPLIQEARKRPSGVFGVEVDDMKRNLVLNHNSKINDATKDMLGRKAYGISYGDEVLPKSAQKTVNGKTYKTLNEQYDYLVKNKSKLPKEQQEAVDYINEELRLLSEPDFKSQPLQEGVNPLIQEARKYKSAEEFVKAQEKNVLQHASDNPNLTKFDDLTKVNKVYNDKLNEFKKLEVQRNNIKTRADIDNFDDKKWTELRDWLQSNEPPKVGGRGANAGDGIYLSSKTDLWRGAMEAEGKKLGKYDYDVLVTNPEKAKQYFQPSGGGQQLPETLIQHNEGIVLGKTGKYNLKKQLTDIWNKSQPLQEGVKNAKTYINKKGMPVKVEQASAMEINNALVGQGKKAIFQEDLPLAAARMGISTGRKQAGVEFLEAVKGLKSEEAIKLANETHEKMTNPEALAKAIKMFDSVQNIWKAQALVAPSYHIRNFAGNLWNNFLADVKTPAYAMAGNLQRKMATGKLTTAEKKLVEAMEKHGVINTGQFTGDIAQTIAQEVGKTSYINPFSQRFVGYRGNRSIGSGIEDNAKIAHFLSKRAEGYGVKEAAQSVKKYLFDYGDLTNVEKGLFKRIMPFYTWTSKNIPLQIQQFIENPGKFSKIATAKKDIEQRVEQPNEKYMSQYINENGPIRYKKDAEGNTKYFLLGQWLPAAAALQVLYNPIQQSIGMASPVAKLPLETIFNKSSFFQNTLGEYDSLKKYPGQKTSYLGLDLDPRTVNALRSLRPLNELNKLNFRGMFGEKNKPSILQGLFDNASTQRGGKFTPESTQSDRIQESLFGKSQNYNPKDAKFFYDRDTDNKVSEFNAEISRAKKNNQLELAEKLIKKRNEFKRERNGSDILNKSLNPYYK